MTRRNTGKKRRRKSASQAHWKARIKALEVNGVTCVPIHPRAGIFLKTELPGTGQRFASIFRSTWNALPLWARRRILRHWREPSEQGVDVLNLTIELISDVPDEDGPGIATCCNLGHYLEFYEPLVDRMPDECVTALIAHELAHVLQYADDAMTRDKESAEEIAAEIIRCDFGIDEWVLDVWMAQYVSRYTLDGPVWRREPLTVEEAIARCQWVGRGPSEPLYNGVTP